MLRATEFGKRLLQTEDTEQQIRDVVKTKGINTAKLTALLISVCDETGIPEASDQELLEYYQEEHELIDSAVNVAMAGGKWIN